MQVTPKMAARLKKIPVLVLLLCLAFVGAFLVVRATPYGLGLRDDSFRYISSAQSLAAGDGYGRWDAEGVFHPLTNFPPLYSASLALSEKLGIAPYRAARAESVLASAGLILIVGGYLYYKTSSGMAAVFGSAFVTFSTSMITTYVWVLSEPLSNLLILSALIILAEYVDHPSSRWLLAALILISALAFLTRYANFVIAVTAVISLLFLPIQPLRKRISSIVIYSAISMLPLAAFIIRNALVAGSLVNRPTPFFHAPVTVVLEQGAASILQWILPRTASQNLGQGWAYLLVLTLIGIITVAGYAICKSLALPRSERQALSRMVCVFWIFFITYVGSILGTLFWFDRLLPLNDRILSPLFLTGLFIILGAILTRASGRSRSLSILAAGISAILLIANASDALSYVAALKQDGLGYASTEWRTSRTMKFIEDLPDVPIYSNDIPAAYLLAGRIVHSLPIIKNPSNMQNNPNYQSELARMRFDLLNENGYIVLVGSDPLHRVEADALPTFTEGLELEALFPDGAVFHTRD